MEVPSRFKKISDWLEENDNFGDIQLHKNDDTGIGLLYIDNPNKRNALTGKIMVKFCKLITELENWKKGKFLIVYGSRNFFCSGLNLNLVKKIINREWHSSQMASLMADNFRRLRNLSLITIALVEGKSLGGGSEFAANLDMRIFTEKAQIGFVHKKMGICTAWMGAISLTKLLGPFKAIEILLSARLIGAEEAFNIGLANYVINSSTIDSSNQTLNQQNTAKQIESLNRLDKLDNNLNQFDSIKQLDKFDLKTQKSDQNKPIVPVLNNTKLKFLNENRTNYCKKIFKRLKKKDGKEDKLTTTKRCKLDVDSDKIKLNKLSDKLNSKLNDKEDQLNKKTKKGSEKNESSKMFKRMKRILFDVEEKYVNKSEIELSSCSEDEIDKVQPANLEDKIDCDQIKQDGQLKFKVGLNDEDDNTILNLVYNWLARLTACLERENWLELKQLVREQKSSDSSIDLLSHFNLKLFNHKANSKCYLDSTDNKWQVLKSINSVSNQTV